MREFSEFDDNTSEEEVTLEESSTSREKTEAQEEGLDNTPPVQTEENVIPTSPKDSFTPNHESKEPITETPQTETPQTTLRQQAVNIPTQDNQPGETNPNPSPRNQTAEAPSREEIVERLTSSTNIARTRYPKEMDELSKRREEALPKTQERSRERQDQLQRILENEEQTKEEKKKLEEERDKAYEKLDKLGGQEYSAYNFEEQEKKRFVPFREKRIERNKEKLQELTETLTTIGTKLENIQATKETLEKEIEERPELEPLRKRFEELLPLFTTDLMTPEEKKVVFDPEFLSTLSTEEYLQIWKLGSPHYTSHVTRQGIYSEKRNAIRPMVNEEKIWEQNNFKNMLTDEKQLRSTISALYNIDLSEKTEDLNLQRTIQQIQNSLPREASLEEFLGREIPFPEDNSTPTKQWEREILSSLRNYFQKSSLLVDNNAQSEKWENDTLKIFKEQNLHKNLRLAKIYDTVSELFNSYDLDSYTSISHLVDKSAIHLANDQVLDDLYGAEEGNQVFVIYPTDMIASQYTFGVSEREGDITKRPSNYEKKWNDIFVWTDHQNIPLDAGIVFLPENAQVNPDTGSQHEIVDGRITPSGETISSKGYWERYFEENPEQRPKHIFYYNNQDSPTKAVNSFLLENNIVKVKPQQKNLGFEENCVDRTTFDSENPRIKELKENSEELLRRLYELVPGMVEEEYRNNPVTDQEVLDYIRSANPYRIRTRVTPT